MSSAVSGAQATIPTSTSLLHLLGSIAGRLARDEHPLELINGVFGELATPLALSAYLYYQSDKTGRELSLLAYRGVEETIAAAHDLLPIGPPEISLCVWPASGKQTEHSSAWLGRSDLAGLPVGAQVPLRAASHCLGSFVVAGRRPPFSADEIELLETVGHLIAAALDRRRLRYQLQTEHGRFRALLDHMPAAVLLAEAKSGRIVMGNPQAERMLGHAVAADDNHAGEAEPIERSLLQAVSGESDQSVDYLLKRRDGTATWLRASGSPIRDPQGRVIGNLITCYDIDQEKRAEAALRDSEQYFRQLADATPQIIWAADPQGRVDYLNKQWFEYTRLTEEQSYRDDVWKKVIHPDDLAAALEKWAAAVRAGTPLETENRLFDPARGEYRWHLVRALPLRGSAGQVVRWLGTATDIDERIRMQQALVKADRSKDEFLAILGHELRNPLSAIGYALAMLEVSPLEQEGLHSVELIRGQVEQISRLIEDLLDLSRVKQGKIAIEKRLVDLAEVVGRAVEVTRPLFEERRHTLDLSLTAMPLRLEVDPARLEQITVNLLVNAARYTDVGGRISLAAWLEGEQACLRVRDNGIGMSPEALASAFQLFKQDSAAQHRSKEGLGIGLALVEALARLHQGTVRAHSDGIGCGSEFTVRLPLLAGGQQSASASAGERNL
jgi:PAS domain S-box-containing protein